MQTDSSGGGNLFAKVGASLLAVGLLATTLLPLTSALRNGLSDSGNTAVQAQLSRVPVFAVTDETGRPFLTEAPDGLSRTGYFFVKPQDAERFVTTVGESGARVIAVGLDEALKYVDRRVPAKSLPERFELFPDGSELALAQKLSDGAFERVYGKGAVPLFYLEGLAVQSDKESVPVFPLFFEKEKLDEMVASLRKSEPKSQLDVKNAEIIDLKQTIREIRAGSNPRLERVVFVPMVEASEKFKQLSAAKSD